jgi:methylated-DNA-[protein]-cysteine S-methyltransferase
MTGYRPLASGYRRRLTTPAARAAKTAGRGSVGWKVTSVHGTYIDSPIGPLLLEGGDGALCRVWLPGDGSAAAHYARQGEPRPVSTETWLADAARQFAEYFEGTRTVFALRLAPAGTPFQRLVWDALLTIPYGATWSYTQLARTVGRPNAVRAVGLANGANPLAIVIPCHRVIGSNGRLTGYGGGLPAKRYLLDLERRVSAGQRPDEFSLA